MSDIADRLREQADRLNAAGDMGDESYIREEACDAEPLMRGAADEIERLRAENAKGLSLYMGALNDWRSQIFWHEATERGILKQLRRLQEQAVQVHKTLSDAFEAIYDDCDGGDGFRRLEGLSDDIGRVAEGVALAVRADDR